MKSKQINSQDFQTVKRSLELLSAGMQTKMDIKLHSKLESHNHKIVKKLTQNARQGSSQKIEGLFKLLKKD